MSEHNLIKKDYIAVAMGTDQNYVPHMGALIVSILDHMPAQKFLDLSILDGGIKSQDKKHLEEIIVKSKKQVKMTFYDMRNKFKDYPTNKYFTTATYYRLLLPEILLEQDRVIFLDSDMIVIDDLSKLYEWDLQGYPLGVVRDILSFPRNKNITCAPKFMNSMDYVNYLSKYLGLGQDWNKYFNSGMIVLDLKKIRDMNISQQIMAEALRKRYWLLDQDILNIYFKNQFCLLPMRWNVSKRGIAQDGTYRDEDLSTLLEAVNNPSIIHYCGGGRAKPWYDPNTQFAGYYFTYLRQTPWYEQVMLNLMIYQFSFRSILSRAARSFKQKMRTWRKNVVKTNT